MVVPSIDQNTLSQIEHYLTTTHHQLCIPGLAIAIVQGYEIIYQCGLGEAAPDLPTTPATPFILGSLSKSFTALAIMQLVEAGKLELDAPVQHYIPWLCLHDNVASSSITIRHLLAHASGISRYLLMCLDAGVSGGSLLSPQGFAEMYTPQAAIPGKDASYALGWRIERLGDEPILRHGGEVTNFRADMVLVPGQHLGVIAMSNCNNGLVAQLGLDQIALNVVRLLLSQPLPHMKLTFRSFYALVDTLIVLLSLLQIGSLVQLLRSFFVHRPPARVGIGSLLTLLGDVIGPVVLLWRLPKWIDMTWNGLLLYVPDVPRWIVGMIVVSLAKSGIHMYKLLKSIK